MEVKDQSNENISRHLLPVVNHIKQCLSMGENCLIYGYMDMSVCSVFAAAFLIYERELDCKTALRFIFKKCGAKPNPGFKLQLEQFEVVTKTQRIK